MTIPDLPEYTEAPLRMLLQLLKAGGILRTQAKRAFKGRQNSKVGGGEESLCAEFVHAGCRILFKIYE